MIEISENVYRETADRLLAAIGESAYYNGAVTHEETEFLATLRCTLVIYREEVDDPSGRFSRVTKMIPVWWEFETTGESGPVRNDFSWRELKSWLW